MDTLKIALKNLNNAIQKLEGAVVITKSQRSEDKEKITTLHNAIVTTYARIDAILSQAQEKK